MEKYRESIELAERITRYLEGNLSDMEELELEKDLQGIPEGEKLLERIRDPKAIVVKKEIYESFDAARSWNKIQKATSTKNSKQIYRVFWYAAILILPLAVAASFLYVSHFKAEERPNYIVNAYFESHKTMLELPGGQLIALDTVKNVAEKLNQCGVLLENGIGLDYTGVDSIADSKVEYHRIIVPRGGEYNLKLADGTNVWVFAESEIRFPTRFKGNKREVYLEGEAYFDVTHDEQHPFIVHTEQLNVKVLGTGFNVMAYKGDARTEVTLVHGKVDVKSKNISEILTPSRQFVMNNDTREYEEGCQILRKYFDHPAITTDVIVGFPGETEEEFAVTKEYLKRIHFYEMHIFQYSKREGTKAAVMEHQVPEPVKKERSNILLALEKKMSEEFREYYVGKQVTALMEEAYEFEGETYFTGYTKEYVKIAVKSAADLSNQFVKGTIRGRLTDDIYLMVEF